MEAGIELLIIISCVPVIVMCAYIYNKDKDKEPTRILRKLFIYGILSIVPIVLLELLAEELLVDESDLIRLFIKVFVGVGLIEEGAKWVIVNKSIYNDVEFNHAYDAIIYCVFVSLGFALIENFLYVFSDGFMVGVFRGITTIPSHTFDGIVMGYFLGKTKQADINNDIDLSKKHMFLSLIVPIICHSLYDFFIFASGGTEQTIFIKLFFVFIVIMYIVSYKLVRKISFIDNNFDGSTLNTKDKKQYISSTDLFNDTLVKVFVVNLILIAIYSVSVLI